MTMGNNIQLARLYRGYTQIELAAKLNIDQGHLANIERNHRTPSVELLIQIKKVLKVEYDLLIEGKGLKALQIR